MMRKSKAAVFLAAGGLATLLAVPAAKGATVIGSNQSAQIDGWNISAPAGVSLAVTSSGNEIFVEKSANFTAPNQGFQVAFQPVSGASSAATSIDFTDETIQNNSGSAFGQFQFLLLNTGSANATFASQFAPPSGSGYSYSTGTLNSSADILTYTGNQNSGTTSLWGSSAAGDNLLIDTPAGADFSLKELPSSGGGNNGGGGGSVVPLPSAAWQSVAGLGVLAAASVARKVKRQRVTV
jgi:hypothetical protein